MNIVILDLEWNAAYSRKIHGYINEIIEFGAVKCDEKLNVISTFSSFVKLSVGKKISNIVSELTSIKDENLSDAMPFMQVVSKFKRWAGDSLIMTWGISDIQTLIENCRYFSGAEHIPFLSSYCDAQLYCESMLGLLNTGEQLGLNKAAEMLNIDVSSLIHHRALGDSMITLEILNKIYSPSTCAPFVENALKEEFYRKMTFRTSFICDFDHPEVKKQLSAFKCEKCGGDCQRTGKWSLRNKKFSANFRCSGCGYLFTGRVQLKQKYEGITVTTKSVPLPIIEKPRDAKSGPVGNMNLTVCENGAGLLTFRSFEKIEGIKHAFSTRLGGKSENEFASMNLGLRRGDNDDLVYENFAIFTSALGVDKNYLVAGAQDHHTNIRRVTKAEGGIGIYRPKDMESIDGLCTDDPGVTLVVYAADCVPLYYYDPEHKAIGLAHAGWRGTANDMAGTMVRKMQTEFGTDPHKLIVAIGPSIGPESFEVDKPCADEFLATEGMDAFVTDDKNGKYHVDLWAVNREFLVRAGVKFENIEIGNVDTYIESDLIFSHRKTRGQRGSNAGFLQIDEK
ncbi:MAG: peptidoglycan editing factor PgeF [Clostridia bacterium]|nr:peptidoglycan editing factor PgeF [Clostridia bacterium]